MSKPSSSWPVWSPEKSCAISAYIHCTCTYWYFKKTCCPVHCRCPSSNIGAILINIFQVRPGGAIEMARGMPCPLRRGLCIVDQPIGTGDHLETPGDHLGMSQVLVMFQQFKPVLFLRLSWSSKTPRQWQEKESLAKLRLSLAEYQVLTPFSFVMFRLNTKNTLSNDHDMPFRSRLNTIETCWNGTVNLLLGFPLCSLKTVSCWCLWPTNLPQSISKPCQAHVSRTVRALLRLRHRN